MQYPTAAAMSQIILRIVAVIQFVVGISLSLQLAASEQSTIDDLFFEIGQNLKTEPEKATIALGQLQKIEQTLSKKQTERYHLLMAASLSFRGQYQEQVTLISSMIESVIDPDSRAKFLYYLSHGYASLGDYEHALMAINEGVTLLPKLIELDAKIDTLQGAVTLLNSLNSYNESLLYADRIYALEVKDGSTFAKCIGLADKVEINFLLGNGKLAQSLTTEAIQACNASGTEIISLIVKALAAIDQLNILGGEQELGSGSSLLTAFSKTNQSSDYVTQLEEAMARAYLKKGQLLLAERYAIQAYQRAKSENVVPLMEKTSETMANIKRAQGQLQSAVEYYEINLALKKKVLDDQLQKNLAYQRVKFDTQDKANQLQLLEQKNQILTVEKKLAQRSKESLVLLITLGTILLAILGAWLLRTLQQKNIFRTSSQIDGLTQVSNRTHFVARATQAFKNPAEQISLMLFDMDHFKKINDTYGHATGDWVLTTVSARVRSLIGKTDLVGRLGGEEFAVCLPGVGQADVLALAERCRAAIARINTGASGYAFPISASFGIATRGDHGLFNFEETLAAADKALYVSKSEGRDRVSVYG